MSKKPRIDHITPRRWRIGHIVEGRSYWGKGKAKDKVRR